MASPAACPLPSHASGLPAASSTRTSAPPEEAGRKKDALISRASAHQPSPPQPPVSALSLPHCLPQLRAPPLQQRGTTPTAERRNARWEWAGAAAPGPGGCSATSPAQSAPASEPRGPSGAAPGLDPLLPTRPGQLHPEAAPQRGWGASGTRPGPRHRPRGPPPLPWGPRRASAGPPRGDTPPPNCPTPCLGPSLTSGRPHPCRGTAQPTSQPPSARREARDAQPLRTPAPPRPLPGSVSSARPRARASHARGPESRHPAAAAGTARSRPGKSAAALPTDWEIPRI